MASFKRAREAGAPGIELDIHVCASGELIVAHDDSFERTAGDERLIEALTLREIGAIDVGSFFHLSFVGEHPPLLEDVLEECCPGMYVDIELKTRKTKNDPLPGLLAEKLKSFREEIQNSVTVSSFNPISLMAFKKLCPHIPTAVIWSTDKDVPPLLRYGLGSLLARCDYLKPVYLQVPPPFPVKFALWGRRPVVPWTIDDPSLARRMLKTGCAGIITNKPQNMGNL
jgi:glycerophosphoryl diester phosphodiesterase